MQKNFKELLEDINKSQKDFVEKMQTKLNNLDNEKRKYNLIMLGILWRTYLSTLGTIEEKEKVFTTENLNLIKSISLDEEKDKNKNNNFIPIINEFENLNKLNSNENLINKDLYEANILKIEKKKSDLKLALNNLSKEKVEEKAKMETCIFCTEEFEENDIINPQIMECKKYIHGKCLINYVKEELNNNRFPIRCPLCTGKEKHEMNYKTILDCLLINDKDDLVAKLENISLNYLAGNNSDEVTFCPTAGCSYMCFYDKNEYRLNCPICKKIYCLKCKVEWHKSLTCEEYQRQKKEEENDIKFEEYAKGSKLKQCPRCKRWVEKISGCDHITCPCGTHFCYKCGEIRDLIKGHICSYGLFGNNNYFQAGSLFGNNNYFQAGSLFGYNNNNQSGSLFGNNNNNQGVSLFGYNNNKQTVSLFGNNNNNQSFSLFGNNNNNQSGGLFGNNNNKQTVSLFGNNNNNQSGGLFENNNNNQGVSLFGNNNNNQSGGLFGNNNNKQTVSLFGNNNNNQSFSLFENNNNNPSGGLFGNNNNNQGVSLFGNNNNNQSFSLFENNNNNQSGDLFGNTNNHQAGGLFGNNNNQNRSIFGNNNNRGGSIFDINNN